jgi:hypothetical protein
LRFISEIAGGASGAALEAAAKRHAALKAERDLGLHVGELLLHELVGGQRLAELLAVQRILPGTVPAIFRGTHDTPGNAIARLVEAAEGAAQALGIRQQARSQALPHCRARSRR